MAFSNFNQSIIIQLLLSDKQLANQLGASVKFRQIFII